MEMLIINKIYDYYIMVLSATDCHGNAVRVLCSDDGKLETQSNNPSSNILLTSSSGVAVYADTQPVPTVDGNNRLGWLYKKTIANADKFNYYFYSQGSHPVLLGDLRSLVADVAIDNWQSSASVPFFVIYTKPTGVGDSGAWYHSRVAYAVDSSKNILLGEHINLYCINKPKCTHNGNRDVELTTVINTGECLPTEEILTIALHSDSAAPINTQVLVSNLGYELNNNNQVYFNLIT